MLFIQNLLAAGVVRGTPLLLAALGELFAERSGILNLGVEGMMLLGAAVGFKITAATDHIVLGFILAVVASAMLALLHAVISISLRGDQVVSGLGLGFFGMGLASIIGADCVGLGNVPRLKNYPIPMLSAIPVLGPIFFVHNGLVYLGYILIFLAWFYLFHTRWGLQLRAVGERPASADAQGINVAWYRYTHCGFGGAMAGLAGSSLSLAITPGWIDGMTVGQGWIAVGLVIFAGWHPIRAAWGSYLFGSIRRLPLDLQGIKEIPALRNPNWGYFLDMLPYVFTLAALIFANSNQQRRQRFGSPAALGRPFSRGESD